MTRDEFQEACDRFEVTTGMRVHVDIAPQEIAKEILKERIVVLENTWTAPEEHWALISCNGVRIRKGKT